MQIELTLSAAPNEDYAPSDLGFLLHKHPDRLHTRETSAGVASVFFPVLDENRCTALLHLAIDPVGLVRGKGQGDGLLEQYVNDRPYVANSFLSVALARSFGQSLAGKSKERQDLADRALPLEARVTPVAVSGGRPLVEAIFAPLGYEISDSGVAFENGREILDLTLKGSVRLRDLLSHLYVLIPVLDNAKHFWFDREEVEKLLSKGEGWLSTHPAKELITRRALRHRRGLVREALARLEDEGETDQEGADEEKTAAPQGEEALETPIRLHELRLNTVVDALKAGGARRVLDIGCGEGKLIGRLIKERGFDQIIGIDPSVRALEVATRRLRLGTAGEALRQRVSLNLGSLTYADRRWRGFDAAALVEVIEHIDPPRISAVEQSVFGDARPGQVIVTTPNREYNALFETMPEGELRHADHRFEWTRAEFETWGHSVASRYGYTVDFQPIGPLDDRFGAPSQMAVFQRAASDAPA